MTSKLTRERIEWLNYAATGLAANGTEMAMSPQDVIALTECCLAAMDSEPVAWIVHARTGDQLTTDGSYVANAEGILGLHSTPLYRNAQPAPVVPDEITKETATIIAYGLPTTNIGEIFKAGHDACRADMLQAGNSPANDITNGKPFTITLPDISSKVFWSGTGKAEVFHPETYRRWAKEAIERYCAIARIDVEVK